jgi:hypothetical protein
MGKALSQRGTKSARNPILLKGTTPLTTKTMSALIHDRKNIPGLAFHASPQMHDPEKNRFSDEIIRPE